MNIGLDAKRAYHNGTGLGHYSRTLIDSLSTYYPGNEYYLFNPKSPSAFAVTANKNIHEIRPQGMLPKLFPSAWRSKWITKDLEKYQIDLYHGLSHEIPVGICSTTTRSVVTIHDLIHERYPDQYKKIDATIYTRKFRYACENADKIIAISKQTSEDVQKYYGVSAGKIEVCYQACNPLFSERVPESERIAVRKKYDLPEKFFLNVGSIIERKNLLTIVEAMGLLKNELNIPLVVIGNGGKYKETVKAYLKQNDLTGKVIFLSDHQNANDPAYRSASDFPAIYQSALTMLYPSTFEGFGIPVLEALYSRLPVITSNLSSLPEAGGDAAFYVDPISAEQIANAMRSVSSDAALRNSMIEKGWKHAQHFTPQKCAASVMEVYQSVINL